jgi:hypothetical protein
LRQHLLHFGIEFGDDRRRRAGRRDDAPVIDTLALATPALPPAGDVGQLRNALTPSPPDLHFLLATCGRVAGIDAVIADVAPAGPGRVGVPR